ncbi:translation initiation factor IF-3 [Psychromicrobium silvestre]|uniref:Translation initiation factor IF-3 n=1 Tax=Psychromicrobium silvestre TaxID=1645614 RepID=A0A7Y9J049_9MICC|nr:translation initiation factor IF-3 [Psychromicrobium silvestre]
MVGPAGEQVGIVRIEDALRLAAESDLDLVEVAPMAKPPVAKLMDFGKYKYEAAVKAREARKNQTNTVLKEIRFRLKIDKHDYETKTGHALRFLGAGDKVKAMIQFRGREQQRPEMGIRLLQRFAEDVAEVGVVESTPRIDGRNMVMVIGPLKNKAEAKAEARRAAQRAEAKAANEAKVKIDVDGSGPMTQSLGDLLPEALKPKAEEVVESEAVEPEAEAVTAEAPVEAVEAPVEEPAEVVEESQPEVAQPEAVQTQAAEPEVAPEPKAPVKPAAVKPAEAKPVVKPAAAVKPVAAKPAAKPEAAKPSAVKPAAPRASTAKPAAAKPAASKPSAAKPAASKPAASRSSKDSTE